MKGHMAAVLAVFCSALTCGATFLFALYRQFALVEVAACIVLGVELYFLSSTIGDWIEKKLEPSKTRKWIALGLAAGVVCYFLVARLWNRNVAG
jgi:uncharacterized PurR-regulated membrane protein YhhQ (DUF165 family)